MDVSMSVLVRDLRHAFRAVVRRPGGSLLIISTLALGVGASTAMFSVVDTVLLRPLPYPDADEIVSVHTIDPRSMGTAREGEAERVGLSYPEFRVLREQAGGILSGWGLLRSGSGGVIVRTVDGDPELVRVGGTNADLFARVLRVSPVAGRLFTEEDVAEEGLVLLTEDYWRSRLGADPRAVGSTVYFEDHPRTVIGVVPAEAELAGHPVSLWALWGEDDDWARHDLQAIGRLAPGVTVEEAADRLSTILAPLLPEHASPHAIEVLPWRVEETREVRGQIVLLSLASLLLLAVACFNVAALTVGRGIRRRREFAVRTALGAGSGVLIRQILAESALLGASAGVLGAIVAAGGTEGLIRLAPGDIPRIAEATVAGRALAFAVTAAIACTLAAALAPALRLVKRVPGLSMGAFHGSPSGHGRAQRVLVTIELALATVLLVGTALLGRTLYALNTVNLGFAADETLALRVTAPSTRLFAGVDLRDPLARARALEEFYNPLVEGIEALPGIRGAALTSVLPLTGDRESAAVEPEGYEGPELIAEARYVSHDYMSVLGMRILHGRPLSQDDDRAGAPPSVILSESLARAAWSGASAVGRRITLPDSEGPATVVGVAADTRDEEVHSRTAFAFYLPRRQAGLLGGSIVIRADGDPVSLVPAVRERVREVDRSVAVNFVTPFSQLAGDRISTQRFRARLILTFSVLAVILALMGVYGVTARAVAARRHELGVRSALGANRRGITGMILGQVLRLAIVGGGFGIAVALLAGRGIERFLWGVEPTDPLTLVGSFMLISGGAVAAALAPALRASRVDPVDALRSH
jgi:predicted permease